MRTARAMVLAAGFVLAVEWGSQPASAAPAVLASVERIERSDAEWRELLSPERYHVLREAGTEPPGSGAYLDHHEHGVYRCAGCGQPLFSSSAKYDSGTGWPAFTEPLAAQNVELRPDDGFGLRRTEVLCARCGSHLGHVFEDGPRPTGLRYCINSLALEFESAVA